MKKLLSLLSVLTISGTAVPTTIAASPYQKEQTIKNSYITYQQTNNLETLKRNKRQIYSYNYDNPDLKTMDGFLKNLVVILNNDKITRLKSNNLNPEYALSLSDDKFDLSKSEYLLNGISIFSNELDFVPVEVFPVDEKIIHSHKTELIAGNEDEDKMLSGAYSYNVTDSFSYKFGQKISIKTGLKIKMLASFEITGELSSEQSWTKTKSYTITVPSQWTKVKANHKKEILFSVFQGKNKTKGFLKAKLDPNLKINTFFERSQTLSYHYAKYMKLKDLIEEVKNKGYSNLFNSNSLITKEGENIFWNIPFELESESSRLSVKIGNNIQL